MTRSAKFSIKFNFCVCLIFLFIPSFCLERDFFFFFFFYFCLRWRKLDKWLREWHINITASVMFVSCPSEKCVDYWAVRAFTLFSLISTCLQKKKSLMGFFPVLFTDQFLRTTDLNLKLYDNKNLLALCHTFIDTIRVICLTLSNDFGYDC